MATAGCEIPYWLTISTILLNKSNQVEEPMGPRESVSAPAGAHISKSAEQLPLDPEVILLAKTNGTKAARTDVE